MKILAGLVFVGLLSVLSFAQDGIVPWPIWPCSGVIQVVHNSLGETNTYKEELPGGAWDEDAAAVAAAANYHSNVWCDDECSPPAGCVKQIFKTYDEITYLGGPDAGGRFMYSIKNFKVSGKCTTCPDPGE